MAASSSQPLPPPSPIVFHDNGHQEQDAHAWKQNLPVGIRFRPNSQELILHYLAVRAAGYEIYPAGIIGEADISVHHPQELALEGRGVQHDDGKIYFFTHVKRKGGSSSKNERKVERDGSAIGFWRATQARAPVLEEDGDTGPIGTQTPLAFHEHEKDENGKTLETKKTNWLMTEIRLPQENEAHHSEEELALSVVYFNQRSRRE